MLEPQMQMPMAAMPNFLRQSHLERAKAFLDQIIR